MFNFPNGVIGSKKFSLKGLKAEAMKVALQTLGVSQGESGAETEYLRCRYNSKDSLRPYGCFVAQGIECKHLVCGEI